MPGDSRMCATLEIINWKPGRQQEAIDLGYELQSELRAVPGRKQVISTWNDDGVEYNLSIWESPEAKAAAAAEVNELAARFGDMVESFETVELANVWYIVE